MREFIKGIPRFSVYTIIMYLIVAWICAHVPFLEQRWSRGLPNWAQETSAGEKLKVFASFCASQKANSINCIVGSSTALHGVKPHALGPNWFNASTRGQNLLVTEAYVDILSKVAEDNDVSIDTILVDVYPEFQQEWVVKKMDAIEDMAQSLPLNLLWRHRGLFLRDRYGSRLHARIVHHFKKSFRKISDNDIQPVWREFAGYEPLDSEAFKDDHPLPWDHVLSPSIRQLEVLELPCRTLLLHTPPTIHENHKAELLELAPWLRKYEWIDGHTFFDIRDTAYFKDDHHMNDSGASLYSSWLSFQLRRNE